MAGKPVFHNDVFFLGRMSVTYFNPTSGQWLYLIHEGKSSCNICLYPSIHPFVLLCVSLTVFVYIPFGHLVYSFTWSTDILITSQNGGTRLLDCVSDTPCSVSCRTWICMDYGGCLCLHTPVLTESRVYFCLTFFTLCWDEKGGVSLLHFIKKKKYFPNK